MEDDGRYTGFCFKCQTYVPDPYSEHEKGYKPPKPTTKSPEDVAKELAAIGRFPQEASPSEKLEKWAVEYFGVRFGFDEQTASEVRTHYYPYYDESEELVAYQVKILENKKFFSVGDFNSVMPFGWKQAVKNGSYKLFITEGQKDCIALTQTLKKFGQDGRFQSVISLPNGVKSVDKMHKVIKSLDKWKEIVICFDMDDAGQQATKNFLKLYPTAKVAKYALKDAHDMVMAGRDRELFQAVMFQAKTQLPDKLRRSSDVWDQASQRPEQGMSWPWPEMTSLTRGIRRGEGYYFGGGVTY